MLAFGRRILVIGSFIVLLWIIIGIIIYRSSFQAADQNERLLSPKFSEHKTDYCKNLPFDSEFWRTINLQEKIPESIIESQSTIIIHSNSVIIEDAKIHYLFAKPNVISSNMISVLLLHGQSFTSDTWKELGTIRILAAMGYFPIAVDLPGYGKSPSITSLNKASFLDQLISSLNLQKPVLISPSMSGSFSLKFLIEHSEKLGGYIPVAPVHTSILDESPCKNDEEKKDVPLNEDCQKLTHFLKEKQPNLNCIKVPSLVVWGELDRGENSAKLCLLPESHGVEIPQGKHAAYLSNSNLWHELLYNFLSVLTEVSTCKQKL